MKLVVYLTKRNGEIIYDLTKKKDHHILEIYDYLYELEI